MKLLLAVLFSLTLALPAFADKVEILMVKAVHSAGLWNFDVTIHHHDVGSDHMMDSIAIFSPDEVQLETADIPMPSIGAKHITTQVRGVEIPKGTEFIIIRGHCSTDGWSRKGIIIPLM